MKNYFEFRKVIESVQEAGHKIDRGKQAIGLLDKKRAAKVRAIAKKYKLKTDEHPSTKYRPSKDAKKLKGLVDITLIGNPCIINKAMREVPMHPDVAKLLKQQNESLDEAKLEVTAWTGRKPPAGIKIVKSQSSSLGGKDVTFSGPENKLIAYAHKSLGVDKKVRKLADVQKEVK